MVPPFMPLELTAQFELTLGFFVAGHACDLTA
jgi:hypothetical protein